MIVLRLAWRSVRQRPLSSTLTAISVALGVALTIAIVAMRDSARDSYLKTAAGYDLILGPQTSSPLQIVLNTMFHVGDAGGTIPWDTYEKAKKDTRVKYARAVRRRRHVPRPPRRGYFHGLLPGPAGREQGPAGRRGCSDASSVTASTSRRLSAAAPAVNGGLKIGMQFQVTHGEQLRRPRREVGSRGHHAPDRNAGGPRHLHPDRDLL